MSASSYKLLYIGCVGRSGSTLLGRALGEARDAICVGEMRYLWSRGIHANVRCGCGAAFLDCPFWQEVGHEAFGGWSRLDSDQLAALNRLTTSRHTFLTAQWTRMLPVSARFVEDGATAFARIYDTIARVSGARTIVDISKTPGFASLLMRLPDQDVRLIHLVRDSRAVAYSWQFRPLSNPLMHPCESGYTDRPKATSVIAARWLGWNAAFHMISARRHPYFRLRYEDFVGHRPSILRDLSTFADEPLTLADDDLTDAGMRLGPHHIFSGNPMRKRTGWIPMQSDDEWQSEMPSSQLRQVTAATLPLLVHYGYPVTPVRARRRPAESEGTRSHHADDEAGRCPGELPTPVTEVSTRPRQR